MDVGSTARDQHLSTAASSHRHRRPRPPPRSTPARRTDLHPARRIHHGRTITWRLPPGQHLLPQVRPASANCPPRPDQPTHPYPATKDHEAPPTERTSGTSACQTLLNTLCNTQIRSQIRYATAAARISGSEDAEIRITTSRRKGTAGAKAPRRRDDIRLRSWPFFEIRGASAHRKRYGCEAWALPAAELGSSFDNGGTTGCERLR